jgi:hypothetical protein
MPFAYQRSLAALGRCLVIALAMSSGLGAAQVNQPEPATKQKNAPSQVEILNLPLPVRTVEDDAEKKAREAVQQRTEDRDGKDLLAQEGMKIAADRMADYSRIQTWLIGIGTLLLMATLWLTRQANEAAQSAVTVTRAIGEAQSRAYVFVHEPKRTRREDSSDPDPWDIEMDIKNFGQTPAYGVQADFDFTIVDTTSAYSFAFPTPRIVGRRNDIGPGHYFKIRVALPDLRSEVWTLFKQRQKTLFVWGRVTFTDAFGHERWMTFRMFQDGNNIRNFLFWHEGNETSETPKRETE